MRRAKTAETLRAQAATLLCEAGAYSVPVPVSKIADHLGAQLRFMPYEGELAGMIARNEENTVIGVNSLHPRARQRFTIAHEIGHLLLHDFDVHIDTGFSVKVAVKNRDELSSQAVDPDEIEANRFAAELLMPADLLISDLRNLDIDVEDDDEIADLADRYQVSRQAMTFRITNLLNLVR
jgi:Zn-dependent peptidase ImmA (M78 family)